VRGERKELLPEALLDLPEVGRLATEGGPMHLTEGGEPFAVVTAEEEADALVGIEPQELADDLDGKDLCIRELGCGSAASDAPPFETVVHEAEDGDDEGVKIQEKTSVTFDAIGTTPSVHGGLLFDSSPQKKLAHGVIYVLQFIMSRRAK
jgi:hypothetical protein